MDAGAVGGGGADRGSRPAAAHRRRPEAHDEGDPAAHPVPGQARSAATLPPMDDDRSTQHRSESSPIQKFFGQGLQSPKSPDIMPFIR